MGKSLKIVITGPESVGKSTLTKELADYYSAPFIGELACTYISKLNRPYTKDDVLEIAHLQIEAEKEIVKSNPSIYFLDTDLIITKVWLEHVYGDCPAWIDEELTNNKADFHLLCYYDLPWVKDPVRENPDLRPYLFDRYETIIRSLGIDYGIVKGSGDNRFHISVEALGRFNSRKICK
jgi:nicotinamide riboside kinase